MTLWIRPILLIQLSKVCRAFTWNKGKNALPYFTQLPVRLPSSLRWPHCIERIQGTQCYCQSLNVGLAKLDVGTLSSHLHKPQCQSGSSLHSAVYFLNKPLFGLTSVGRVYLRNQGRKFWGKQRKGKETMSDSRLDLHCFCLRWQQNGTWRHHNWPSWRLGADRWRETSGWRSQNTKWKGQPGRLNVVFMYFRWRRFAFCKKSTQGKHPTWNLMQLK